MSVLEKAAGAVTAKALAWAIGIGLILLGLLGLSVALNVRQWADHRAYVKAQDAELRAAAALASTATSARLARGAQGDNRKLMGELSEIVERGRKAKVVYQQAADARPLPAQCAPGQERLDAVNAHADR